MPDTISRAELARLFRVSRMAATKWVRRGLPLRADGKLNREEAVQWVRNNALLPRIVREAQRSRVRPVAMPTEEEWERMGAEALAFLETAEIALRMIGI